MKVLVVLSVFLFLFGSKVFAYPNFIGHGYNSCITCHYNPFGNGPINDYGRAVSATAIGARTFYSVHKPEEQLGKEAGFFFKEPTNKHFRPFIGYRGMLLKRNMGQDSETTEWINMQLDANAVLKYGERDQYIASFTFGYAPVPRALKNTPQGKNMDEYRSREHYVGWRPKDNLGIYAGLMDKPFGIRLVEHTAYSRTTPYLTMNDQSHGVAVHYLQGNFEGGVNYFIGNLTQDEILRQKGVSGTFEYTLAENFRPGLSYMSSGNEYVELSAMAMHLRSSLGNTGSLMTEFGSTVKKDKFSGAEKKENYGLLQAHLKALRGNYILNSIEYYKNTSDKSYRIRFGPSYQYFPMARVELRFDLYNTRVFSTEKSRADTWDFLGQVHLWF